MRGSTRPAAASPLQAKIQMEAHHKGSTVGNFPCTPWNMIVVHSQLDLGPQVTRACRYFLSLTALPNLHSQPAVMD